MIDRVGWDHGVTLFGLCIASRQGDERVRSRLSAFSMYKLFKLHTTRKRVFVFRTCLFFVGLPVTSPTTFSRPVSHSKLPSTHITTFLHSHPSPTLATNLSHLLATQLLQLLESLLSTNIINNCSSRLISTTSTSDIVTQQLDNRATSAENKVRRLLISPLSQSYRGVHIHRLHPTRPAACVSKSNNGHHSTTRVISTSHSSNSSSWAETR